MKNNVLICLIFLLLFLLSNSCSKERKSRDKNIISEIIYNIERENINRKIENQCVFLGNDSLNMMVLACYVKEYHPLFLYFTPYGCSSCLDTTIELLKSVFIGYEENERIVFVSPEYPKRFRENCYGKRLLTFEHSKLDIPIEERGSDIPPFFFVLNENLEIQSIHVVNKQNLQRTKSYLLKMKLQDV